MTEQFRNRATHKYTTNFRQRYKDNPVEKEEFFQTNFAQCMQNINFDPYLMQVTKMDSKWNTALNVYHKSP